MTILITGVAGFIGCNLARTFLAKKQRVAGFDNFCRGKRRNLEGMLAHPTFAFAAVELSNLNAFFAATEKIHASEPITEIWHMAANSDIPGGIQDQNIDLRDTFMTTFNTLKVMKELGIPKLAFASSSAIYGDLRDTTLHEDIGPLFPISNYGAMKLASEATISAAIESWLDRAWIFRFPNVVGTPATHGALLDFIRKLQIAPDNLDVLGDGSQQKAYLHVDELIDAMLFIREHATERIAYYNIGADDNGVTVRFMAEQVVAAVSPGAHITYGTGNKGWVGDVPKFVYALDKLHALGWHPKLSSAGAVKLAVRQIVEQESSR